MPQMVLMCLGHSIPQEITTPTFPPQQKGHKGHFIRPSRKSLFFVLCSLALRDFSRIILVVSLDTIMLEMTNIHPVQIADVTVYLVNSSYGPNITYTRANASWRREHFTFIQTT